MSRKVNLFYWRNFWAEITKYKRLSALAIVIYLVIFMVFLWGLYWILYVLSMFSKLNNYKPFLWNPVSWHAFSLLLGVSIFIYFYYYITKDHRFKKILQALSPEFPDKNDLYHLKLNRVFNEASIASGLRNVELYVIPISAYNAFTLKYKKKYRVYITEGLVSILNADELRAVISHELSHIANGDTDFITLLTSFTLFFQTLFLSSVKTVRKTNTYDRRRRNEENVANIFVAIYGAIAYLVMFIFMMMINRNREYLADAVSVKYTRDPYSLVNALEKIKKDPYRTGLGKNEMMMSFSPLCFVPLVMGYNEKEGAIPDLFASHPPIDSRIKHASEMITINKLDRGERYKEEYYVEVNGEKLGPFSLSTIVNRTDFPDEAKVIMGDIPVTRLREIKRGGKGEYKCPICDDLTMEKRYYEGVPVYVCNKCSSMMVRNKYVKRILIRPEVEFSKEERKGSRIEMDALRKDRSRFVGKKLKTDRRCPRCRNEMYKTVLSYYFPMEIEKCDYCDITFFDKGEIETLQAAKEKL